MWLRSRQALGEMRINERDPRMEQFVITPINAREHCQRKRQWHRVHPAPKHTHAHAHRYTDLFLATIPSPHEALPAAIRTIQFRAAARILNTPSLTGNRDGGLASARVAHLPRLSLNNRIPGLNVLFAERRAQRLACLIPGTRQAQSIFL